MPGTTHADHLAWRGMAYVDDRQVITGIIHVLRSGGRWVEAPASYGPRKML
jgi:transposase